MRSSQYRIGQAAVILAIGILLSRGLGFVTNILLAARFGVGSAMDAFQIAYALPLAGVSIFIVVLEPLIPLIVERRATEGNAAGWTLVSGLGILGAVIGLAASLGVFLVMPWLVGVIAPGFDAETRATAELLGRIFSITLGLGLLAALAKSAAQAYGHFVVPALATGLPAGCSLLFLLLFPRIAIAWIAVAITLGTAGQLFLQLLNLRRLGWRLSLKVLPIEQLERAASLTGPALWIAIVSQVVAFGQRAIASLMGVGIVSAMGYAYRVVEVPISLFTFSIPTAMFPAMAEDVTRGKLQRFRERITAGLVVSFILIVPIASAVFVLAEPIMVVLFMRGSFDAQSVALTTPFLRLYALSLLPGPLIVMFARAYYAMRMPRALAVLVTITSTVSLSASWVMAQWLGPLGILLGSLTGSVLQVILYYARLRRTLVFLDERVFLVTAAKLVVSGLGMGAGCAVVWRGLEGIAGPNPLAMLAALVAAILCGGSLYLGLLKKLHVAELDRMIGNLSVRRHLPDKLLARFSTK